MTDSRFARTTLLWGIEKQKRLKNSTVLVVGCGAVGSFALEALARAGVGRLIIVDCDTVSRTNINRQLFAVESTIGQPKITAAAKRLHDINPDIDITEVDCVIDADTASAVAALNFDFAIDAIDSLSAKAALITAFSLAGVPFVSSMGAALKTDLTQVRVTPMKKTKNCPLAAMLRKKLRRAGVDLSFPTVCSTELPADSLGDSEQTAAGIQRSALGSVVTVTGLFGLLCADTALRFLIQEETHGHF